MDFKHKHEKVFIHFLIQTKELYNIYMTQGKRYRDALELFKVNSRFLEFITQILTEVDSNSTDQSDLVALANHLISWKKQFLRHQQSQSFNTNDKFFFVSKVCFPSQSVDNLLSR